MAQALTTSSGASPVEEHGTLEGGGIRLAYSRWRGGGRSILVQHGGGQTRHAWEESCAHLGDRGYDVVALDLRGHGESAWSPAQAYSLPDFAADVTEMLDWVGLGDRINAYPPVLSGGEKQRAAIARAVIGHPEILLADEPTGNVDPPLARRLMRLFTELNKLGTSVVIATHDINLMNQFNARRLVLEEGRLTVYD